jgi:hypothetical protein
MILSHALFDITLSFFAVTLLLCLLSELPPGKPLSKKWRLTWILPCLLLLTLSVPQIQQNIAIQAARDGDISRAMMVLQSEFLRRDTQSQLLYLHIAANSGTDDDFEYAMSRIDKTHADVYAVLTVAFQRRGDYERAAQAAEQRVIAAPYNANAYDTAEYMIERLEPELATEYTAKLETHRAAALAKINPLAKYMPDTRGLS